MIIRILVIFLLSTFCFLSCKEEAPKNTKAKKDPYSHIHIDKYKRLEAECDTLIKYNQNLEYKIAEIKGDKLPRFLKPKRKMRRVNKNTVNKVTEPHPNDYKTVVDLALISNHEYNTQIFNEFMEKGRTLIASEEPSYDKDKFDSFKKLMVEYEEYSKMIEKNNQ